METVDVRWYFKDSPIQSGEVCAVCHEYDATAAALLEMEDQTHACSICSVCLAFLKGEKMPPSQEMEIYKKFSEVASRVLNSLGKSLGHMFIGSGVQLSLF